MPLNKHLIQKTRPEINPQNAVYYKNYRITVLFDRLFRVEKDDNAEFFDGATQSVWFRDMPKVDFTATETDDGVVIKTAAAEIIIADDFKKSRVILNGKKIKLDNQENLLGTCRTLDNTNGEDIVDYDKTDVIFGKVKLDYGVCAKDGVAVLDDSESLALGEDGFVHPRKKELDLYVFAYGKNYKQAVRALYEITGYAPMLPRYALGNWWSRYYDYTDKSYLALLDKFKAHNVPITVATLDMDWHYSDNVKEELNIPEKDYSDKSLMATDVAPQWGVGWTGYTWNKNLFPDYKAFLKEVNARGLKITLNLHPASGVRYFEEMYGEFCAAMGLDPALKQPVRFDFTSVDFINNYFDILHKPYEKDGVKFWWLDWQQGAVSKIKGLDPLWALNHYHYLDNGVENGVRKGGNPLILSRYSGVGSHRYPVGFSGDDNATWEELDYLPYFTLTASNVGYGWWSHDIGGHQGGDSDGELFVRFCQFGAFNPIMRLHSGKHPTVSKEPWIYKNGMGYIAEEYMRLRHKLIPYLYTANYNCHKNATQLIEPLYYYYPDDKAAYSTKNEYFFGGELLVCPITKPTSDGCSRFTAYLPDGEWTDIFTGVKYTGGRHIDMVRHIDEYPVFAASGAVIPYSDDDNYNSVANPENLRFDVYSGLGEYTLYEDGIYADGSAGEAFTTVTVKTVGNALTVSVKASGDLVYPATRKITLSLKNAYKGEVSFTRNGAAETVSVSGGDNLSVTFKYNHGDECVFTVTAEDLTIAEFVAKFIAPVFSEYKDCVRVKRFLYNEMLKASDFCELKKLVVGSDLSEVLKEKTLEILG